MFTILLFCVMMLDDFIFDIIRCLFGKYFTEFLIDNTLDKLNHNDHRFIIVYDADKIPNNFPSNCEVYNIKVEGSKVGNAQRNLALDLINDGWIYFNDDDTIIHPKLWENIKDLNEDFISFMQECKDGSLRLEGRKIAVNYTDSHNFVVSRECIGDTRWEIDKYYADGIFAEECYKKAKTKIYIPKVLSTYNSLR
jgi:hypothetical protein